MLPSSKGSAGGVYLWYCVSCAEEAVNFGQLLLGIHTHGTPLLIIGTSAGKLLPKAGAWMDTVKQLFGALMLGVAAWMLSRLVSDRLSLLLYCVPFIAALA